MQGHLPKVTCLVSKGTRTETILVTIVPQEQKQVQGHIPLGDDASKALKERGTWQR